MDTRPPTAVPASPRTATRERGHVTVACVPQSLLMTVPWW